MALLRTLGFHSLWMAALIWHRTRRHREHRRYREIARAGLRFALFIELDVCLGDVEVNRPGYCEYLVESDSQDVASSPN